MKRTRAEASDIDSTAMASWLVLLSRTGRGTPVLDDHVMMNDSLGRVFECKTCNRQFSSFQALGGHRASHKKQRLMRGDNNLDGQSSPVKPKTHGCSICGLEFAIGQALGGHMRRHRAILNDNHQHGPSFTRVDQMEVVNRSEKVVLRLDLNLTPLENDLHFFRVIGKAAPLLDCFF